MDAFRKEKVLNEVKECFENESISEIRKGYYVIGLMVILFDRRTIVLLNIAITFGLGLGLNAVQQTTWVVVISLIVNLLLVRFLLFGRLLKDLDEEQEEFRIQFAYIKELMQHRKK